jgi:TolB-like protein
VLIAVEPQVFDLVLYLLQNRDRVVGKDDLIQAVWGGRIVSDSALTTRINAARTAIGDSGKAQRLIKTFPRKGFRFVGSVRDDAGPRPAAGVAVGSFVVRAEGRASGVLMGEEEGAVLAALRRGRDLVVADLQSRGARIVPTPTDTVIAVFTEPSASVSAAAEARNALAEMNRHLTAESRVHYRFGVAAGALVEGPDGAGGPGVERAAALGLRASPDAVRMSEGVHALLSPDVARAATKVEADEYELDGARPSGPPGMPAQLEALDLQLPNRPSIVILPFRVAGEDNAESEPLAEGLRLDVQNALTKMSGVFIVAAASANALRGWSGTEAATRVGVRYALEGTVQRSADRVRVSVQLIDALAGSVQWSERYDRALDRHFGLQDEVTARIVTALDVRLASGAQARIWHKCLADPQARECFYRGVQAFIRMNRESVAGARTFFERLIEIAPDSPFGPTWLALCYWFESTRGWADNPVAAREQAGFWAERAVTMEDADGQAHTVLGNVRLLQRRFDEALAVAQEALGIRPGCANANGFLSNVLLYCGEPQRAVVHARRAIRYMPVYPPWFVEILASAYRDAGMLELAIIAAREVLRILPTALQARMVLASALVRSDWLADARRIAAEVRQLEPNLKLEAWASSQPYRDSGVLAALSDDLRKAGLPA